MAPLTMFQKACTAVATAGGAGGAVFGYAVKRQVEDAEFRVWLRETSPMAAKQVDEFMAEYMPQTVTAIRVEEDMGEPEPSALTFAVRLDGGAALPRASHLHSPLDIGINLGNPPPLPRVSDAAKTIFGQLEPKLEPTEAEAAAAAAAHSQAAAGTAAAARLAPSAIGVGMPQQALNVQVAEQAGEIAPDEPEEDEPAAFPDGARWGGGSEGGAWYTQGPPPPQSTRLLVPAREAARFEEALLRYAVTLEALPRSGATRTPTAPPSPPAAPAVGVGAAVGSRVISLPEDLRDGCYGSGCGTAAGEAGEGGEGGGGGDTAPLGAVRAARLQWLRVQEAYAEAEEAALALTHAALRREAARHNGGGAGALLRVGERRRQVVLPRPPSTSPPPSPSPSASPLSPHPPHPSPLTPHPSPPTPHPSPLTPHPPPPPLTPHPSPPPLARWRTFVPRYAARRRKSSELSTCRCCTPTPTRCTRTTPSAEVRGLPPAEPPREESDSAVRSAECGVAQGPRAWRRPNWVVGCSGAERGPHRSAYTCKFSAREISRKL
jgi:hypothetical protein